MASSFTRLLPGCYSLPFALRLEITELAYAALFYSATLIDDDANISEDGSKLFFSSGGHSDE